MRPGDTPQQPGLRLPPAPAGLARSGPLPPRPSSAPPAGIPIRKVRGPLRSTLPPSCVSPAGCTAQTAEAAGPSPGEVLGVEAQTEGLPSQEG